MEEGIRTELEAAAFRRLVKHLRERTDVQNVDLMELAGFCQFPRRPCLANSRIDAGNREEAAERGLELSDPEARRTIYGMPYEEWKARYQRE